MARILATGTDHNLVPNESGSGGTGDVYRYVTFIDYRDAVHTVFLETDHPLTDPQAIVQAWEDGTLTTAKPEQPAQQQQQQGGGGSYA